MANVIGESIEKYVANQINARQFVNGSGVNDNRSDTQINLLNSNTSWVKLGSGISVSKDRLIDINLPTTLEGMGLAKNNILFGGTSKLENKQTIQREGFLPREANSSYTYDKSFGFSPMAGIESVDVKTLNRGSLKKATVKLKANDRSQFDIIELLYLRLGYTVLLEWGNAFFTTNGKTKTIIHNTLMETMFFEKVSKGSYLNMLDPIESKRAEYAGNYDALFGKISNFNWSFNPDGTYDIELTIISLGDVIESLKTNISPSKEIITFLGSTTTTEEANENEEPSIIEDNKDANIISSMLYIWKYINKDLKDNTFYKVTIQPNNGTILPIGNFCKNEQNNESGGDFITSERINYKFTLKYQTTQIIEQEDYQYWKDQYQNSPGVVYEESWTSFNAFVYITGTNTVEEIKDFSPEEIASGAVSEYAKTLREQYKDKNKEINNTVPDGTSLKIKWKKLNTVTTSVSNPIQNSPSKSVFKLHTKSPTYYIRFGYLLEYITNSILPRIEIDKNNHDNNPPIFDIDYEEWNSFMYSLPNQISLDPRVCIVNNSNFTSTGGTGNKVFPELMLFKPSDENVAYPLNIYLNFEFVLECLKSDDKGNANIFDFISNICTGLNKSLGGINNLEPVIDETSNTLKIIDTTPIPGYSNQESYIPYTLQMYGYNKTGTQYNSNFIRNFDLKTAITPGYATMITIGATAGGYVKGTEATAFSKWNVGLRDRYKEDFIPGDLSTAKEQTPTTDEAEFNYVTKILDSKMLVKRYGFSSTKPNEFTLVNDLIESNLSIGTEYYRYLLSKNKEKSGGTIGFIPFKLSLKMDGISGIKIYNKLQINTEFLPNAYGKYTNLIVTGISHNLSNNDWETSIETTVIPNSTSTNDLGIDLSNAIKESITNVGTANTALKPARWPYYSPNDAVPLDVESPGLGTPPTNNTSYSVNSTIKTKYIPALNQITGKTKGFKMLALIMAQKEGFYSNTKAYRTNNPGNIGNTDSGGTNTFKTLKEGIQGQFNYIYRVATGKHNAYPLGRNKDIQPFFSPEISNNQNNYTTNPYLPGYKFTPYIGTLEQFIKIYSTAARGGNGYLSGIISFYHKNGFTNVTEKTTLEELIKLNNSTPIIT